MRTKPLLIGICGAAGAGKDTLAHGIAKIDVYYVYNFALPIKLALNAMFGWQLHQWDDREWKEKQIDWLGASPRVLAQTLGTEWGREIIDEEIWLKIAQQKYEKMMESAQMQQGKIVQPGMIIPDVRFPNEAHWIREAGGVLLEVQRPGHNYAVADHVSEGGISEEQVSAYIINDGPPSKMITDARRVLCRGLNS